MKKHLLLPLLFSLSALAQAEDTPPNIIFLFADDQNTLSVGCYGNDEVQTPHMDQLGKDGMIFDKHYNTTAICMASRANVFTGMYEYKTGTNFTHGNMKPEVWEKSYPMVLRKNGYLTGFAGKFGLVVSGVRYQGDDFDLWGGSPGQTDYKTAKNKSMAKYAEKYPHSTLSYGAFGQDFIRLAKEAEKPFCLSISFKAPHKPATPDPRFDEIYAGKTFTKPGNYGREHGEHLSPQSKAGRQYVRFDEWGYRDDYDKVMATYYQQVYAIDQAVGMIREELEAQDLVENTVVIYTSDNGYICGSHGYGSKVLPMEESSRAPFIIYDPRHESSGKGLRCDRLTANIDFAPTILELAGLPVPKNMDGMSLLPLMDKPTIGGHEQLAFINTYGALPTQSLSCFTRRYKYTYWWYSDDEMKPTEELFDLEEDPLELVNLAAEDEDSEVLAEMRKRYQAELEKWKRNAVLYNDYVRYGTLFDPAIPFAEKKTYLKKVKNKPKDKAKPKKDKVEK